MHLVIGAGEFLGDHVSRALAVEAPVIELRADVDDETLADAMKSVEVVHSCAQTWSPAYRLKNRKEPPELLRRIVEAARHAGVRRIVHVSTADVYGPDHVAKITEKSKLKPTHAYEHLKLNEETWLFEAAPGLEAVVLRPGRIFGLGEDWMLPNLMRAIARGRVWLPGGGRVMQTFIAAEDVGRACLAAADRGRTGSATCSSRARAPRASGPRSSACLTNSPMCERWRPRRPRGVARTSGPTSSQWTSWARPTWSMTPYRAES
ncbi:MAG: SDR family oxidoreductase [Chloroflexi bacterium]|nr:MAG: SDR family oxidoreductase [Chloroflexota bacterium]